MSYTDLDHDSQYKVLSNLILSYLLKYISRLIYAVQNVLDRFVPIYFHRTKCPRYATQTIDSTNCPFIAQYIYLYNFYRNKIIYIEEPTYIKSIKHNKMFMII
jgi:hypothetical protein